MKLGELWFPLADALITRHPMFLPCYVYSYYSKANYQFRAVDSILRTLKQFGVERRYKQGAEQLKEEKEWKELWESMAYKIILYACSLGSVDAVQILFSIIKDCDFHL